jgi:O-antigen ligase
MVFPANYVVKAIGADGYAAALVSYAMLAVWFAATLLGQHNPFACRYPVRVMLAGMWAVTIASYVLMDPASLSATQLSAADRWLMQLAGVSGVILVTAEGLHTLEDVKRVLRTLTWGGAFCGIVAVLQFKAKINLAQYLKLPGFAANNVVSATAVIVERGSLNRVFGTAIDPIELGVSAGMLLALAAFLLMHDNRRAKWKRVVPLVCIALAVPASVSRSAVLAAMAALGVLVVTLPPTRRLKWLAVVPVTLVLILAAAPGLIGTLISFFVAGESGSDLSVAHRTNNYPYVEQLVRQAPWLGTGGGTYVPVLLHVLDNQYLTTAIELGLLGFAALVFFLAWPVVVALVARRRTSDPELRDLCAALAGAELAAVICAATFDGFSFPMFYNLQALIVGLAGAAWMMANRDDRGLRPYQNGGG